MIGIGKAEPLTFADINNYKPSTIKWIKGLPVYYAINIDGRLKTYCGFVIVFLN